MKINILFAGLFVILLSVSCRHTTEKSDGIITAFVGGMLIDGTGKEPVNNSVILVRNGRIAAAGPKEKLKIPSGAGIIDIRGKTVIPGLINAHAHVGDVKGIDPGHYSAQNINDQLGVYARYGFTTVMSLGGDKAEAVALRNVLDTTVSPGRARLYIAGNVVTGNTPEEAIRMVDDNAKMGVDIIKIRVDDNLGTTTKMGPEIYRAVILRAHDHKMKLAAHMYYLEDARKLVQAGADFLAHSVRDREADQDFIDLLKEHQTYYCPTLTRELSTFVYEDIPSFFNDPFFLREVDSATLKPLKDPEYRLSIRQSRSAQTYKQQLQTAMSNLKKLSDSGVTIVFGTDTGVPARFQGYFEHLELELMAEAGMSPMQILLSATKNAAQCIGAADLGTIEAGKRADFVVLDFDPLSDIRNSRSISSVWIGGKQIPLE